MVVLHTLEEGTVPPPSCVALGMFDGLHIGHRVVIGAAVEQARRAKGSACVFTFDPARTAPESKQRSGGWLLSRSAWERQMRLMQVDYALCVDFADFCSLSPEAFVRNILAEHLQARFVSCGENFRFGHRAAACAADLQVLCAPYGIEVHVAPLLYADGAPVSSTRIRKCVREGDMPGAERLLGRRYHIDFPVVEGRRLGRELGTPTINQPFPPSFVVPRFGVYATVTVWEGQVLPSVTSVGVKPTVGSDCVLAETYILGYSGNLYGQQVPVEFLEFLRPEEKFSTLEELRAHIHYDCAVAAEIAARAGFSPRPRRHTEQNADA